VDIKYWLKMLKIKHARYFVIPKKSVLMIVSFELCLINCNFKITEDKTCLTL
jgi:hypothetical protein